MIYFTWSVVPTAGKEDRATKWILELAKYANDTYKQGHVEVTRNMDGAGMMHWVYRCPSLTVFDQVRIAWGADKRVQAADAERRELFGPPEQHFYEIVEQ